MQRKQFSRRVPRKPKRAKPKEPTKFIVNGVGFLRLGDAAMYAYSLSPNLPRGNLPAVEIRRADGLPIGDFWERIVVNVYHGFANFKRDTGIDAR